MNALRLCPEGCRWIERHHVSAGADAGLGGAHPLAGAKRKLRERDLAPDTDGNLVADGGTEGGAVDETGGALQGLSIAPGQVGRYSDTDDPYVLFAFSAPSLG